MDEPVVTVRIEALIDSFIRNVSPVTGPFVNGTVSCYEISPESLSSYRCAERENKQNRQDRDNSCHYSTQVVSYLIYQPRVTHAHEFLKLTKREKRPEKLEHRVRGGEACRIAWRPTFFLPLTDTF